MEFDHFWCQHTRVVLKKAAGCKTDVVVTAMACSQQSHLERDTLIVA